MYICFCLTRTRHLRRVYVYYVHTFQRRVEMLEAHAVTLLTFFSRRCVSCVSMTKFCRFIDFPLTSVVKKEEKNGEMARKGQPLLIYSCCSFQQNARSSGTTTTLSRSSLKIRRDSFQLAPYLSRQKLRHCHKAVNKYQ